VASGSRTQILFKLSDCDVTIVLGCSSSKHDCFHDSSSSGKMNTGRVVMPHLPSFMRRTVFRCCDGGRGRHVYYTYSTEGDSHSP
jgi:hypothetical protein